MGDNIMKNKRKKKKGFRLRHLVLLLLIFGIGRTLIGQRNMMKDLTEKKQIEEQEVAQLKEEIEQLDKEIKNKESLVFVEKVARENLRMVKPREIIYIDKNKNKNHFINFSK